MVKKMKILLTTFASNGSGWVPEKVIKEIVSFARYQPITCPSYIALPSNLQICRGFEYLLLSFLTYTQQNWSFSSKKDIIPIHMLAVGRSSTKNSYRLLMNVVTL